MHTETCLGPRQLASANVSSGREQSAGPIAMHMLMKSTPNGCLAPIANPSCSLYARCNHHSLLSTAMRWT